MSQPNREIRFTRAAQATTLWLAAATTASAAGAIALILAASARMASLASLWALALLAVAALAARLAVRCSRHAYLILTPIGIEIFPFFRPAHGLRVVAWSSIAAAESTDSRLTLHFNREMTSGIHLSLRPIPRRQRHLLATAVSARLANPPS